ncbi:MAG TPA: hypothetical protein VL990_16735 [Acidobacteriaceae bacterium]|nr:hypothetical protein [Acidobacteriaceae bacterium]
MVQLGNKSDSPGNSKATQWDTRHSRRDRPGESDVHGMERMPEVTLGQQIRAHANRPHKGDVGRPGTNEEVFQGSKETELK